MNGVTANSPSLQELLDMLPKMNTLSEPEKQQLRDNLRAYSSRPKPDYMPHLEMAPSMKTSSGFTSDLQILVLLIATVALVFVFFGYKLYKSLAERERRKEEKKRQKQQKKKK